MNPLERLRRSVEHRRDNDLRPTRRFRRLVNLGIVEVGRHSYGAPLVHVFRAPSGELRSGKVVIGSFVSMAEGVRILTGGEHRTDWVSTAPLSQLLVSPDVHPEGHPATKGDVLIGNDVWVGLNATILSGVRIGDGAVVGAGAIVASDVAPYEVVVGNPARSRGTRFPPATVARLLETRWWDWPDELIREHLALLQSDQVDRFLDEMGGRRPTGS